LQISSLILPVTTWPMTHRRRSWATRHHVMPEAVPLSAITTSGHPNKPRSTGAPTIRPWT
jgi:hypothetical protein